MRKSLRLRLPRNRGWRFGIMCSDCEPCPWDATTATNQYPPAGKSWYILVYMTDGPTPVQQDAVFACSRSRSPIPSSLPVTPNGIPCHNSASSVKGLQGPFWARNRAPKHLGTSGIHCSSSVPPGSKSQYPEAGPYERFLDPGYAYLIPEQRILSFTLLIPRFWFTMSAAPPKTPITKDELVRTNGAMLALTSIFVLSRAALHISKRKRPDLPDFFIYFSYALYVALWSCYIVVIPPMFRVYAVIGGEIKPYATMMQDAATMLRMITAAQMCFYTLLFAVKMSLLTLYYKLLAGVGGVYKKIWWGILAFCVVVSQFRPERLSYAYDSSPGSEVSSVVSSPATT